MKEDEKKEDDNINNFWPVFGREKEANKTSTFWTKGAPLDLDEDDMIIESELSRIGKKKKNIKNYFYKLFGDYLCYYKNEDDEDPKGYIKLNKDTVLERKDLKGSKETYFYIEF